MNLTEGFWFNELKKKLRNFFSEVFPKPAENQKNDRVWIFQYSPGLGNALKEMFPDFVLFILFY